MPRIQYRLQGADIWHRLLPTVNSNSFCCDFYDYPGTHCCTSKASICSSQPGFSKQVGMKDSSNLVSALSWAWGLLWSIFFFKQFAVCSGLYCFTVSELSWVELSFREKILLLVFNALNGQAAAIIPDLLILMCLIFAVWALKVWTALPEDLRQANSVFSYKWKTHFYHRAFPLLLALF